MNQRIFGKTGRTVSEIGTELPPLSGDQMKAVSSVCDRYLRAIIHPQW